MDASKVRKLNQELGSIKMRDDVFAILFKQQQYYNIDCQDSSITFGNPSSEIVITIMTNPHCGPCAKMHTNVEKLLKVAKDKVCVQYVFTSFSDELKSSGLFLIALYLQNKDNKNYVEKCFNEWFDNGKNNSKRFFNKYGNGLDLESAKEEYNKHIQWCKTIDHNITPLVLINGRLLPENYTLMDINKFLHLLKK